jgi:hypothetical protein
MTVAAGGEAAAIVRVEPASIEEWRHAWSASEGATFFHGPGWATLWEQYSGGRVHAAPRKVGFSDGRSAVVGATRAPTRVPGVERDVLSPEGNCGGWVSVDELSEAHARSLGELVLRSPSLIWRAGPADPAVLRLGLPGAREEVTHVIDLRGGAEAARARWKKRARQAAARALRDGVRVREGRAHADWVAFASLYRECVSGWERPLVVYRDELFRLLAESGEPGVRLWLAEQDGTPRAGAVVLTHRRYAVVWLGASAPRRQPGATNALDWGVIGALAEEGAHVYDLNGSGPLAGVVRYKESIGASPVEVLAFERRHPLERAGAALRARLHGGRR